MYAEQITLVNGSEYARSQIAADQYAKLTAAAERRSAQHPGRSPLARLTRLIRRRRRSTSRLLHLH